MSGWWAGVHDNIFLLQLLRNERACKEGGLGDGGGPSEYSNIFFLFTLFGSFGLFLTPNDGESE
jgi:hypothetical protein